MTITRLDPFRQMARLSDYVNRVFLDDPTVARTWDDPDLFSGRWLPAVDILETENDLVLRAELPGLKPEDVDLRIENNTLTLKGERKYEGEKQEGNYHRRERVYGTFVRSFTLPSSIQQDKVQAEYSNGVLEVRLPKREEIKPKQITVKAR